MSSFFLTSTKAKRKGGKPQAHEKPAKRKRPTPQKKREVVNEELDEESGLSSAEDDQLDVAVDESDDETPQDKRVRLAKQYLDKLEERERERDDDPDHDAIAHRLHEDVLEQSGRLQRKVADQYERPDTASVRFLRGHDLSVTCVALTPDDRFIFSGAKDSAIYKYDVESGRKVGCIPSDRHGQASDPKGHRGHVFALAVSSSGKYLVSGGQDTHVMVWNVADCKLVKIFKGHKKAVSGLAFRNNTHQLFSASFDRSVKVWNLDEMAYIETLYGHQDEIMAIDSLNRERAFTAGGSDKSVRLWKIPEESQLIFHGHTASIDCCKMINEQYGVAGSQDGGVSLWNFLKKKPVFTARAAHKVPESEDSMSSEHPWISAVSAYQNSDLVVSGSMDGCIKFWKCAQHFMKMQEIFSVPVTGVVNSLAFSSSGDFLVAGVGQEHRLGRWWSVKKAKNRVAIIPLPKKESSKPDR
ncbi:U3 small nucleolar RNA-interacting protein 2-like isoform X2 [Sycon ciliatum]|uniref:U3 small nucleolar RNA-interacting protein 2-like isoform X2 n=1 Tax=Sycon ciliatum TaxID=27933 RepID=UPI0031F6AC00